MTSPESTFNLTMHFPQRPLSLIVNSIAGSAHSVASKHYEVSFVWYDQLLQQAEIVCLPWCFKGTTMDIKCTEPVDHCTALTDWCRLLKNHWREVVFINQLATRRSKNATTICYPGSNCGEGYEASVQCGFAPTTDPECAALGSGDGTCIDEQESTALNSTEKDNVALLW